MMFTGNSVRSEGLIAENVELPMNIIDMDLTKEVLQASRHDDAINLQQIRTKNTRPCPIGMEPFRDEGDLP
jgi:hypothetical protein